MHVDIIWSLGTGLACMRTRIYYNENSMGGGGKLMRGVAPRIHALRADSNKLTRAVYEIASLSDNFFRMYNNYNYLQRYM